MLIIESTVTDINTLLTNLRDSREVRVDVSSNLTFTKDSRREPLTPGSSTIQGWDLDAVQ